MNKNFYLLFLVIMCLSCGEDYIPKPKAYLRLDYPKAKYIAANLDVPFAFQTNTLASKLNVRKIKATTKSYGINLEYPTLKGTIFLTYKTIENKDHLTRFLNDAHKFTSKHMIKADEIPVFVFENKAERKYGQFAEVKGNVASQAQFFITDSVKHFITASLYFHAKPNYDSILPAAHYLQNDMRHLMETIVWK